MKSESVILTITWVAMILYWTDITPDGNAALAMSSSWALLWMFGFFKREAASASGARINSRAKIEDALSARQKDFIEKMLRKDNESRESEPDEIATIKVVDEDGGVSEITIKENGDVETEGDPNPEIVRAARMLSQSVIDCGPEAIAKELTKQIEMINRNEK